jgi:hypothetical protein
MVLGGVFFLLVTRNSSPVTPFLLGIIAGLMHLARADGVAWLLMALLASGFQKYPTRKPLRFIVSSLILSLTGYLLIMTPWFLRNLNVFGSLLAPGGGSMLWLTSYDQIFSYPAGQITFGSWWQSGLDAIFKVRVRALGLNLANAFSVQGGMFLWPLGVLGLWYFRRALSIQLALAAWLVTLFAMSIVFPFAGARGGFLHSGAALQTMWWTLISIGLDKGIEWGVRKRSWKSERARFVFPGIFLLLTILLTGMLTASRLGVGTEKDWADEQERYVQISEFLTLNGISNEEVVIVANPPGFWLASGHPAIALPDGNIQTVLALARRYGGHILVLEPGSITMGLVEIYEHPGNFPGVIHLGDVENTRVFEIHP